MYKFDKTYLKNKLPNWIGEEEYQVLFLTSPLPFPLHFAVHPWVLVMNGPNITRWEVWQRKNQNNPNCFGHVYCNYFPPLMGIRKSHFTNKPHPVKIIGSIKGNQQSKAHEVVQFITENAPNYSFKNTYHYYPGPNSNTFIQWILSEFPEIEIVLPSSAIGKRFPVSQK